MQELSEEWQVSRTYIYQQKDQVLDYIRTLDGAAEGTADIPMRRRWENTVSLICQHNISDFETRTIILSNLHI